MLADSDSDSDSTCQYVGVYFDCSCRMDAQSGSDDELAEQFGDLSVQPYMYEPEVPAEQLRILLETNEEAQDVSSALKYIARRLTRTFCTV